MLKPLFLNINVYLSWLCTHPYTKCSHKSHRLHTGPDTATSEYMWLESYGEFNAFSIQWASVASSGSRITNTRRTWAKHGITHKRALARHLVKGYMKRGRARLTNVWLSLQSASVQASGHYIVRNYPFIRRRQSESYYSRPNLNLISEPIDSRQEPAPCQPPHPPTSYFAATRGNFTYWRSTAIHHCVQVKMRKKKRFQWRERKTREPKWRNSSSVTLHFRRLVSEILVWTFFF